MTSYEGCLTQAHIEALGKFVRGRCADSLGRQDAEDIAQSILLEAWAAAEGDCQAVIPLAYTMAKRARYYTRAREKSLSPHLSLAEPGAEGDPLLDVRDTHDAVLESDLLAVARTLGTDERLVLSYAAQGYTLAEASAALGVHVPTLHRRVVKARLHLAEEWAA